jgi:hypothetical protein
MKKRAARKLTLAKETVRDLDPNALRGAEGGATIDPPYTEWAGCFPTAICTYTCPIESVCYSCGGEPGV